MARLVLLSFTPASAGGGVPRWNRDLMAAYPESLQGLWKGERNVIHYSWADVIQASGGRDADMPEWQKATALGYWLSKTKRLRPDDVVVGDGFWADLAPFHPVERTLQVAHGNWSHTTAADVAQGMLPEFPDHHTVQLDFRRLFQAAGGKTVAVSDFISHQCHLQWGLGPYPVIDNGVDLTKFVPAVKRLPRKRPVIVHFVTTANKGFKTIARLQQELDADVMQLDDLTTFWGLPKYEALAQADLAVFPSAHEGNAYSVLETLSCDVPLVSYDVGLMFKARQEHAERCIGLILDRYFRSPEYFLSHVQMMLDGLKKGEKFSPRSWAAQYSLSAFQRKWREFLKREYSYE